MTTRRDLLTHMWAGPGQPVMCILLRGIYQGGIQYTQKAINNIVEIRFAKQSKFKCIRLAHYAPRNSFYIRKKLTATQTDIRCDRIDIRNLNVWRHVLLEH